MIEPFTHHRDAALALLTACPGLSLKAGGFLGHMAVTAVPSAKQLSWLSVLLRQNGLPPLADGGAQ